MSTGEPATPEPGQSPPPGAGYPPPPPGGGDPAPGAGGYSPPPGSYPPPGSSGYPPPGSSGYPPPGTEGAQQPGPGYPPPPGSGYAAPGYSAGGYSAPGGPPPQSGFSTGLTGQGPLSPAEERTWAMVAHLSSVAGVWLFFFGAVGPLVVLLIQGQRSAFVRAQALEALNFNLSVLIYSIVAWILVFVLVGIPIVIALGIFWLVLTVIATVKVSNGEPYRYPLTIRMVT
ncbi:MAG TPA: DUF4870 domain-containing protein [Pseudonocardia sp.]|uniref:DUF4870 domain-containing protein n=1 Tax=Pseudonocardia sp. TaxID=60912 RepID=UPI002EDBACCE